MPAWPAGGWPRPRSRTPPGRPVSRATVYRTFPGGRDELINAVVAWATLEFFGRLYEQVQGAESLEEVMERGIMFAHRSIVEHEVLQRVMQTEPEKLLPTLTVESNRIRRGHRRVPGPLPRAPGLADGVDLDEAADFLARMVLSYMSAPGPVGPRRPRPGGPAGRGPSCWPAWWPGPMPGALTMRQIRPNVSAVTNPEALRVRCGGRPGGRCGDRRLPRPRPDASRPRSRPSSPHRVRIIDATLDCLARHGTPRPPWTTSPARPACPGPPSTGSSPGAGTRCWPRWSTPRWPGCSPPWASAWGRPRPDRGAGRRHRRGIDPDPRPRGPGLPGGARAGDGPRPSGLRRVRPAAGHRLPVHRAVPGPLDEPGGGRAGGRVGHPHRPVLRHRPVDRHGPDRSGPGHPPGRDLRAAGDQRPPRRRGGRRPSTSPRSNSTRTAHGPTAPTAPRQHSPPPTIRTHHRHRSKGDTS